MNVFVTGGSRGIGRAIVLKMVREGAHCAFTYASNRAAADETVESARKINPAVTVKTYELDCKHADAVEKVVDQAITDFDTIDAVVNNAAIVRNNAAVMMSNEEWDEVIATNLSGPFYVSRSFLMHFVGNRNGRIVNISSLAGEGCSGQVNYAASKSGLVGLTKTLAKEYGPKGITSNIVTVGYVETDMTKNHMADDLRAFWMKFCPLRRIAGAEDVANMVYFLVSPQGSFINGEEIRVSGGLTYAP